SEEHTSELQSLTNLVCRLLLEKKKKVRREAVALADVCHAGGDRRECIARGDMDLVAAAGGLGMLLEGWRQDRCADIDALAPAPSEPWRERLAIEPRRAHQLERPRGAPSFR